MPRLDAAGIDAFLAAHFPVARGTHNTIEEIGEAHVRVRRPFDPRFVRPGGTLSGPTLMGLADTTMYFLVLSQIGRDAVTQDLNIQFLRRPAQVDLIGEARLLKLGRRTIVGDILLYSDGEPRPVAHATATYAILDAP
jgi:uncharacterized protein (TIGR00369 family)